MKSIMDFFTKNWMTSFAGVSIIHLIAFFVIKISDKTGFFLKNIFNAIFHLGRTTLITFSPFISSLVRNPMPDKVGFTFQNWYAQYFYVWLIFCISFSFIASILCYFICNSKSSIGKDMQPTWWIFTIILLVISLFGGIIFTPMLSSFFPLFVTYLFYILFVYLPFYISTVIFCGFTAKGSYTIKNLLFGDN